MKKHSYPVDVQLIAGILYFDFRAVLRDRPKIVDWQLHAFSDSVLKTSYGTL